MQSQRAHSECLQFSLWVTDVPQPSRSRHLHLSASEPLDCALRKHDLCRIPTPTTTRTYSGKVGQIQVHVAHNGKCEKFEVDKVGTNAATLTTYLAIQAFKPDLVISAGTAGGFKARGAEIADVFVSTAVQNHDRRIPLPGFDKFGVGSEDPHPAERIVQELGESTFHV